MKRAAAAASTPWRREGRHRRVADGELLNVCVDEHASGEREILRAFDLQVGATGRRIRENVVGHRMGGIHGVQAKRVGISPKKHSPGTKSVISTQPNEARPDFRAACVGVGIAENQAARANLHQRQLRVGAVIPQHARERVREIVAQRE